VISASGFPRSLSAQHPAELPASVEGIVLTRDGRRVEGASVRLARLADGAVLDAHTNHEGIFRFVALAPGDYEVSVRLDRFSGHRERVHVEGMPVNLRVTLAPLPHW
jgi:hypothetical protein